MYKINILISCSCLLLQCSDFDQSLLLSLSLPSPDATHTWSHTYQWKLFYINDNTINYHIVEPTQKSVSIKIDKNITMPVLACKEIPPLDTTLQQCPFAFGGVYPFNSTQAHVLTLAPQHTAQVAQMLLVLYTQQGAISVINVSKLYNTIQKNSPNNPIDQQVFFEYIPKQTLHSYAIKALPSFDIPLSDITTTWHSTSFWLPDITTTSHKKFKAYYGSWLFLSPLHTQYLIMYVDIKGGHSMVIQNR